VTNVLIGGFWAIEWDESLDCEIDGFFLLREESRLRSDGRLFTERCWVLGEVKTPVYSFSILVVR